MSKLNYHVNFNFLSRFEDLFKSFHYPIRFLSKIKTIQIAICLFFYSRGRTNDGQMDTGQTLNRFGRELLTFHVSSRMEESLFRFLHGPIHRPCFNRVCYDCIVSLLGWTSVSAPFAGIFPNRSGAVEPSGTLQS